ncbi:5-oxoprolinase subunit PxpB [Paenibacillus antri]|uniref:5-oxoprolinase subunit PxpB n=1 Tax=Paenibacillus antri TaxID=2582848 RepID=A0A5R9GB48_9BACL|nr:5-oxoprolinase subunit PxpB [Paenibacillus antri]TLS52961.1 5-oxoprolinase subunit PxpB [Paenibacillus antri]
MSKTMRPAIAAFGEQAVIVSFGETFEPETHRQVVRLSRELETAPFPGFIEFVPAYASVCVYFDALSMIDQGFAGGKDGSTPHEAVRRWLEERIDRLQPDVAEPAGKTVRIPVCYCVRCGPDLPALASGSGLAAEAAASLHAAARHTVSMIGFLPGFPYLSGLPEALSAPRLDTPRAVVPRGSVAVAGRQTGIYPAASPGGWRLIGRTAALLFDAGRAAPSLLEIGDTVTFEPIAHEDLERGMRERGWLA